MDPSTLHQLFNKEKAVEKSHFFDGFFTDTFLFNNRKRMIEFVANFHKHWFSDQESARQLTPSALAFLDLIEKAIRYFPDEE